MYEVARGVAAMVVGSGALLSRFFIQTKSHLFPDAMPYVRMLRGMRETTVCGYWRELSASSSRDLRSTLDSRVHRRLENRSNPTFRWDEYRLAVQMFFEGSVIGFECRNVFF